MRRSAASLGCRVGSFEFCGNVVGVTDNLKAAEFTMASSRVAHTSNAPRTCSGVFLVCSHFAIADTLDLVDRRYIWMTTVG
jgi:hypothetical protein